jgi:hypothetical protein
MDSFNWHVWCDSDAVSAARCDGQVSSGLNREVLNERADRRSPNHEENANPADGRNDRWHGGFIGRRAGGELSPHKQPRELADGIHSAGAELQACATELQAVRHIEQGGFDPAGPSPCNARGRSPQNSLWPATSGGDQDGLLLWVML